MQADAAGGGRSQHDAGKTSANRSSWQATRLFAWLQLFRAPNLLTVPGDPIAGFVLAAAIPGEDISRPGLRMGFAAAVALLLYSAGLLWNDWFDLPEDQRERPGRPLPSGRIRTGHVPLVANVLVALAVSTAAIAGRATLWVAVALGIVVLAYDWFLKRLPLAGPLAMGCCRGLSVLIGAAAFGGAGLTAPPVLAASAGITLYVAAVTWLARGETKRRPVSAQRVAIALAFVVWMAAVAAGLHAVGDAAARWVWAMLAMAAMGLLWVVGCLAALGGVPVPAKVQRVVGGLIRGIILAQAALVLTAGWTGFGLAVALMACFLINRALGRVFYAS